MRTGVLNSPICGCSWRPSSKNASRRFQSSPFPAPCRRHVLFTKDVRKMCQRRRFPSVVCASIGPQSSYRAVEGAVRTVNRWLNLRERLRRRQNEENVWGGENRTDGESRKRQIRMRVQKRASREVREDEDSLKSLRSYLVLPPEEYSVLDPKWIERDPGKGANAFKITIPLDDLVGIDLKPIISVRVRVNNARHSVTFLVDKFSLGSPDVDQLFGIQIRSTLFSTQANGPRALLNGFQSDHQPDQEDQDDLDSVIDDIKDLEALRQAGVPLEVDRNHSADSGEDFHVTDIAELDDQIYDVNDDDDDDDLIVGSMSDSGLRGGVDFGENGSGELHGYSTTGMESDLGADMSEASVSGTGIEIESPGGVVELGGNKVRLHCRVHFSMHTVIPPALSFIPNLVLGSVGRIILRAVLNALLPNFLDLVATDYRHWVAGTRDPNSKIGSFVEERNLDSA